MRRLRLGFMIPVLLAVVLTGGALTVYSQEDMQVVEDSGFGTSMRPAPAFRHDEHNEAAGLLDCAVCHHVYDEDGKLVPEESSEGQECSECHGSPEGEFPMELVRRFHLNCRGCHQERDAGPVTCGECHTR
jgi:hypothetical protein